MFHPRHAYVVWLASCVLVALACGRAHAGVKPVCKAAQVRWAEACAHEQHAKVHADACPAGALIVRVQTDDPAAPELRVELTREPGRGFIEVAGIGLSPIGNFPNWAQAKRPLQQALEHVATCVQRDPSLEIQAGNVEPHTEPSPTPTATTDRAGHSNQPAPWPWLVISAGVLGTILLSNWISHRRPSLREYLFPLGLCSLTGFIWWLTQESGFFHQNGHGGLWVEYALSGHPGLASYGPGYREVFGLAAQVAPPIAEHLLFCVSLCLAALAPLWGWIICRKLGLATPACILLNLGFAANPLLARLARSESYFTLIFCLLMPAAAVLISCTHNELNRGWVRGLGILVAGLLVAQAARVHPLAWIPAATLPLLLCVCPGPWRHNLRAAVLASLGIGATVVITSGSAMLDALKGPLGEAWMPALHLQVVPPAWFWLMIAGVLALALGGKRSGWSARLRAGGLLGLVIYLVGLTNWVRGDALWFAAAYPHLFAPVLLAAFASLACTHRHRRGQTLAAGIALVGIFATGLVSRTSLTLFATDVTESNRIRQWRDDGLLPIDQPLIYLGRAGPRGLVLPLFRRPQTFRVAADELADTLFPAGGLYYRSSLCSTPEGSLACAKFEQAHELKMISTDDLAPVASQPWLPLPDHRISIALAEVITRK